MVPLRGTFDECLHQQIRIAALPRALILFYKVAHQTEDGFVAVETDRLVGIEDGVIVLEGITLFVLEEYTRHMVCGKGIVVAVGCQVTTMQGIEVMFLCINLLKE